MLSTNTNCGSLNVKYLNLVSVNLWISQGLVPLLVDGLGAVGPEFSLLMTFDPFSYCTQ